MATAAGGGSSPPPDGGNNGNLAGHNGLVESISDINLTLLQVSNKFLSAKNSVELHKVKGRRAFYPYRSLPSVLHPSLSDLAVEDEEGDADYASEEEDERFLEQIEKVTSSGRSVNWLDLHPAPGHELLTDHQTHQYRTNCSNIFSNGHNCNEWTQGIDDWATLPEMETVPPAKVNEASSHTSLYLQSSDDQFDISVLHVRPGSRPFSVEGSTGNLDLGEAYNVSRPQNLENQKDPCGNHERNNGITEVCDREQQGFHPNPDSVSPTFKMMKGVGGSPDSSSDYEESHESPDKGHVINRDDGLGMGLKAGKLDDTPRSVFFTPTIHDSVSSLQGLTGAPYLDSIGIPLSQIVNGRRDPVTVYEALTTTIPPTPTQPIGDHLEEQMTPRAVMSPPDDKRSYETYYDGDDDVDYDKKPELKMPCVDDIPVPDPSYVASTVPESLRPLIAKTYKKDCRTWLWKSKTQREAVLRQQAEDDMNGDTSSGSSSSSDSIADAHNLPTEEVTKQFSRMDFKT